jgi:hypothetical protein
MPNAPISPARSFRLLRAGALVAALGLSTGLAAADGSTQDKALLAIVAQSETLVVGQPTTISVPDTNPAVSITVMKNADGSLSVAGLPGVAAVYLRSANGAVTHVAVDGDGNGTLDSASPVLASGLGSPLPSSALVALGLPASITAPALATTGTGGTGGGSTGDGQALGNIANDRPAPSIPTTPGGSFGGSVSENNANNPSPTR